MKTSTRFIIIALFFAALFLIVKSGFVSQLTVENIPLLKERFLSLGRLGILAFFLLYVAGCLFFFPGLPLTILGALLFGPLWGTVYTIFSASAGLALAFLSARYLIRGWVWEKLGATDAFQKIDSGVKKEGWRILMITRLVPIFPFTIQNYIYGLTGINFFTYWFLSTLFIIPGTAAYTLSAGAVLSGDFSAANLFYLAAGAVCFVLISLIPKHLKTKRP